MPGQAGLPGAAIIFRSPVAVAGGLALLSAVPIAWSLQLQPDLALLANDGWTAPPIDWRPLSPIDALVLALAVVVPSALIAGWVGGVAGRRYAAAGVLTAITVAWALGIVLLPITAAILHLPLRAGIVCTFGCEAMLRDDQPLSGISAYGQLVAGGLIADALLAVPGIVFALARVFGRQLLAVIALVGIHAVAHVWALVSVTTGGVVPYACLAIGIVIWTQWLRRSSTRLGDLRIARVDDVVELAPQDHDEQG